MDDVTETVFRQIVQTCAPADVYFTEFVNVDGLMSVGRPKLLKKLRFSPNEGPLVAQLWGLKPENFESIARQISDGTIARELGLPEGVNFVGIDINMGCPAKSEVQNGACSALIKNPELASEIIKATQRGAGDLPVSVKTRLGFNQIDLSWHEFLMGHNLDYLTVHGRTRKEMSKVPAQWDEIGKIRELRDRMGVKTKIIGNGDVLSRLQGEQLAEQYGLDGIMIGRGVFQDPYVFAEQSPWAEKSRAERIELYRLHVQLFADTWGYGERNIKTLNKFCKVYISDFDGAKELREVLMDCATYEEILRHLTV